MQKPSYGGKNIAFSGFEVITDSIGTLLKVQQNAIEGKTLSKAFSQICLILTLCSPQKHPSRQC
jgi:hypothetical protein